MTADEALLFVEELIRTRGAKPLSDLQRCIFRGAWAGKDYKEIHQECGQVGIDHLMRNVGPKLWRRLSGLASEQLGEPTEVRKESLRGPIERLYSYLSPAAPASVPNLETSFEPEISSPERWQFQSLNRKQDWGQAPDTSLFQGRTQELATLSRWVEDEGCRVVALVGTAGIGKTDLSVKLTEQLRDRFELMIWRSLDPERTGQPPPLLADLLTDLMLALTDSSNADSPDADSLNTKSPKIHPDLPSFVNWLKLHRCLIVLDGFESVLQRHILSGEYCSNYANYSNWLKRVCDTQHQSCVVLTSRENPREIEARAGENAPVRSHRVMGLAVEDVECLFMAKGSFLATTQDWRSLTYQYDGNPRFLQQVATTITHAFGSDISRFLAYQQGKSMMVGDIWRSLNQQIEQLSPPEKTLMQTLIQHQAPVTLEEIQELVKITMSSPQLLEVVLSLVRRSLLNSSATSYSLHPLMRDYLYTLQE